MRINSQNPLRAVGSRLRMLPTRTPAGPPRRDRRPARARVSRRLESVRHCRPGPCERRRHPGIPSPARAARRRATAMSWRRSRRCRPPRLVGAGPGRGGRTHRRARAPRGRTLGARPPRPARLSVGARWTGCLTPRPKVNNTHYHPPTLAEDHWDSGGEQHALAGAGQHALVHEVGLDENGHSAVGSAIPGLCPSPDHQYARTRASSGATSFCKSRSYSVTGCGTDFLQWKWAEMDRAVGEVAA